MELRGYILKPAPNPKYFGYPNPQIRGRRSKPEPETRKPETCRYPPRTRPAAILTQLTKSKRYASFNEEFHSTISKIATSYKMQ